MTPHRTRPLILWLAALAILWGLLRPGLNAFMASGAGKALITGCIRAGGRLGAMDGGAAGQAAGAAVRAGAAATAPTAAIVQRVYTALLAPVAQPPACCAQAEPAPSGALNASHPSRAPPALA